MAKPTAPLLSLGASGSLAETLVYSSWKGRPYVRRHVIPANPQTTAQTLTRNVFRNANDFWKLSPADFQAAWDLFATGQVLTGRNAFVGQYTSLTRGEVDLDLFPWSPGAKGGLPPDSVVVTPGSTQLSVAVTAPTPPTGWTVVRALAGALLDQDPATGTAFTMQVGEDVSDPYTIVLTGLTASVLYQVGAWIEYTKPDGSTAYGPALNDTGTPTV